MRGLHQALFTSGILTEPRWQVTVAPLLVHFLPVPATLRTGLNEAQIESLVRSRETFEINGLRGNFTAGGVLRAP